MNYTHTVAEKGKMLRKQLKDLGYSNRKVRVRSESYSMGSSIHVTIVDREVDTEKVKQVARQFEEVRRDEYTGETLLGANTYVHISIDYPAEVNEENEEYKVA